MFKETKENLDGAYTIIYPFIDLRPISPENHVTVFAWHEADCISVMDGESDYTPSEARLLAQALIEAATVLESLRVEATNGDKQ